MSLNRPGAARIGAYVTGLNELQNTNPVLNLFSKSFKVNSREYILNMQIYVDDVCNDD